jgi:hypothetical protein
MHLREVMHDQRIKSDALTSLRFFAVMLVLLFHYAGDIATSGPFWMQGLTKHGHSAVTFFFVLSGFILSYSYLCPEKPALIKDNRRVSGFPAFHGFRLETTLSVSVPSLCTS